jgi:hypothetical protein
MQFFQTSEFRKGANHGSSHLATEFQHSKNWTLDLYTDGNSKYKHGTLHNCIMSIFPFVEDPIKSLLLTLSDNLAFISIDNVAELYL